VAVKKPRAPWKIPKIPGLINKKPRLPAAGHYAPSIYNPSGRNQGYRTTPVYSQGGAAVKPQTPNLPKFDWSTITGGGNFNTGGGGGGPTGGAGLIGGDWEVQAAEAAMGAGMARKRGDFQAQLRQALIDLGIGDTSKLGNLSQYIDADTIKAAVENKYSQNAQIGQQAEKITAQTRARNAAMGRLSSGETTNRETEIAAQAEGNRFSALRDFLSGGAVGLSSLADAEAGYAEQIAMARAAAAQRAAETYPDAFAGGDWEAGAGGTLFAPGAGSGLANIAFQGFNPNYKRPVMQTRKQFLQKRPQGRYQNYVNAWKRQHPYGF
jgi:hypothetical protein